MATELIAWAALAVATIGVYLAIRRQRNQIYLKDAEDLNRVITELRGEIDRQEAVIDLLRNEHRQSLMNEANALRRLEMVEAELERTRDRLRRLERSQRAPLNVLGIWPEAQSVNAAAVEDAIYNSGIPYNGLIGTVTRRSIVREMRRDRYTVLQIDSHGADSEIDGRGGLVGGIELSDGLAPPGWWSRLVVDQGVLLVVLLACESQEIADALLIAGIPAVISVAREIEDGVAAAFAVALYEEIARGQRLYQAVEVARLQIPEQQAEQIRVRGEDLKWVI